MDFKELYQSDLIRYGKSGGYIKRFHYLYRKSQTCKNRLLIHWYRFMFSKWENKRGLEISYSTQIGKGLYLGHAYNITINPKSVIGENCNITVGNDVLIAPNSYVNCDIPSHSVVFGNPCIIKSRDNATEGYINNVS